MSPITAALIKNFSTDSITLDIVKIIILTMHQKQNSNSQAAVLKSQSKPHISAIFLTIFAVRIVILSRTLVLAVLDHQFVLRNNEDRYIQLCPLTRQCIFSYVTFPSFAQLISSFFKLIYVHCLFQFFISCQFFHYTYIRFIFLTCFRMLR